MSTWKELLDNPKLKNYYDTRIAIIRAIREFFWSQGFVETDTPLAVRYASQEPYLNPMPVTFHHPSGQSEKFYLHTSPEYSLKKLLCAGYEKIFEICKCFRDVEDFGGTHNPEFTMIEWYRAPGTYTDFMDDMEGLYKYAGEKFKIYELRFKNYKVNINCQWDRMTMKEVWQKYVGVNLDEILELESIKKLATQKGYAVDASDAYEDVFFKIFLNEIEQKLGLERPLFIYDYPASMASLSNLCKHDHRYAERVECYIGGLELCNGFGELTDATEQNRRLTADKDLRAKLNKETCPVDPEFISALKYGVLSNNQELLATGLARRSSEGTATGVAMGVDRMVVLFTGAKDINEVIFGSVADQIEV